jgi:voltage-gated potassium channel
MTTASASTDVTSAEDHGALRWPESVTRWTSRTKAPLDVLALLTIWLSCTPISTMLAFSSNRDLWLAARLSLSVIYAIDIGVRAVLSRSQVRYVMAHPLSALVVLLPPLRLIFSIRLLRTMFRKGNLLHFLAVAALLVLNLALLVVIFEHSSPKASITSIPIALWWTACTVSTVGYGDYTPVTTGGRIVAVVIMAIGLTSVAVITAQIASSFMDQAAARRQNPDGDVAESAVLPLATEVSDVVEHAEEELARHHRLLERLQAIEDLLRSEDRV